MGIAIFQNSSMWGDKRHNPFSDNTCKLKLFLKSRDITIAVSYIISALISCNSIIKHYVSRKITSYIYLLIFTKSLWLHVKHFIALTKRESVRRIVFIITDQDYPCQHIDHEKHGKVREHWRQKRKKACVRIKRVKTDIYLIYAQSRKTRNYT
jgi:hypothetical protein